LGLLYALSGGSLDSGLRRLIQTPSYAGYVDVASTAADGASDMKSKVQLFTDHSKQS
jgi:hypothetical protein